MRRYRLLTAASLVAVLGASVGSPAQAATTGVGTASASSTVLGADLGANLGVQILEDVSKSNIDPAAGATEAFTVLSPLAVRSGAVEALNFAAPPIESRSSGSSNSFESEAVSFPGELSMAVAGSVTPAKFDSAVVNGVARSSLTSALSGVTLGGALVSVDSIGNVLTTTAGTDKSVSSRSAQLDSLAVLDLGSLLDLLGANLGLVDLETLLALLDVTNVSVPDVGDADAVIDQVNDLATAANELDDVLDGIDGAAPAGFNASQVDGVPVAPPSLDDVLDDVDDTTDTDGGTDSLSPDVETILGDHGIAVPDLSDADAVQAALDQVLGELGGLLDTALLAVDSANLLSIEGVNVEIGAVAADSVAGSSAVVNATIGSVSVLGNLVPATDVIDSVGELEAVASTVTGTLGTVLGTIHPDLANVVSVDLLQRSSDVTTDGTYVQAVADLSVATISINPPTNLVEIITGLADLDSVGSIITDTTGEELPDLGLPGVGTVTGGLPADPAALLGGALNAAGVLQPATVEVLGFTSTASFAPDGGVVTGGPSELPRTGNSATPVLLLGGLLIAAAITSRRWLRLGADS